MYHDISEAQSLHRKRLVLYPFTPWRRCCKALLQFCILRSTEFGDPVPRWKEILKKIPWNVLFFFITPLKKRRLEWLNKWLGCHFRLTHQPWTVWVICSIFRLSVPNLLEIQWMIRAFHDLNVQFWLVSWKQPSSGHLCLRLLLPSCFSYSSSGPPIF